MVRIPEACKSPRIDSPYSGSDIASAPAADDDFPLADEEPGPVERDDDSDQAEEAQLGINDDDNRKLRRSARDSRPG